MVKLVMVRLTWYKRLGTTSKKLVKKFFMSLANGLRLIILIHYKVVVPIASKIDTVSTMY